MDSDAALQLVLNKLDGYIERAYSVTPLLIVFDTLVSPLVAENATSELILSSGPSDISQNRYRHV